MRHFDAVVLGAGLFGCTAALELSNLGLKVALVEPHGICEQATTVNQNRVHMGYHYPRSAQTMAAAAKHYRRFLTDFSRAITGAPSHHYCIAKGSKVDPAAYEKAMKEAGIPFHRISGRYPIYTDLIEAAYLTHEKSFDIRVIKKILAERLECSSVTIIEAQAIAVDPSCDYPEVALNNCEVLKAQYLFNVTYGELDKLLPIREKLVKEWVEVPIIEVPDEVYRQDITIMDGPFFSVMRYPADHGLSAMTHVSLGRHVVWHPPDTVDIRTGKAAWRNTWETRFDAMREDARRFIPAMEKAKYVRSMRTTRCLLRENHDDDGRPVLWEYHPTNGRIVSILGSKFNSIYDVIEELRNGPWNLQPPTSPKIRHRRALVGKGLVGEAIRDKRFTHVYDSKSIDRLSGHYDLLVVAAPGGTKWQANAQPNKDLVNTALLCEQLRKVSADRVVLCSTIDVFTGTEYGKNRQLLVDVVKSTFKNHLIVYLPALVGPGLKKGPLYDLANDVPVRDAVYRWFPLEKFWSVATDDRTGEISPWSRGISMFNIWWAHGCVNELQLEDPLIDYSFVQPRGEHVVIPVDEVYEAVGRYFASVDQPIDQRRWDSLRRPSGNRYRSDAAGDR